jgi:hypothetical protein
MRIAVLIAAIVAVGSGAGSAGTSTPSTDLRITYFEEGRTETAQADRTLWTLRCGPVGGTLPKRSGACQKLNAMKNPFAPLPKDLQCTDIYGGPEQALIVGTHKGQRIWVLLAARNGCEIARWQKLAFVTGGAAPGAGGAS